MKIAFFVDLFPAISETFILNQITGLLDLGHDVEIFTESLIEESKIHPDVKDYNLMERVINLAIPKISVHRRLKGLFLAIWNFPRHPILILRSLNFFKYGNAALNFELLFT
ncbi:colanic acid biosynthesis glycosyltransferase WcaL, partial [Acidobacteriota bacterium]